MSDTQKPIIVEVATFPKDQKIVGADEFDPPLNGDQVRKVQEAINEAVRREREEVSVKYPYEDNDITHLGPDVSVTHDGALLHYNGVIYVPQKEKNLQPKELKAYSVGENVEVQRAGDWISGHISSKDAGILNVDTERGPVAVGSYLRIRKVAASS